MTDEEPGSKSTSTGDTSLVRRLLISMTGTTISCSVQPPWTNRVAEPRLRNRLIDLGMTTSRSPAKPKLFGGELLHAIDFLEVAPENKAPIREDNVSSRFSDRKIAFLHDFVLVDEPMVCGDQDVAGIGSGQFLNEFDQLVQSLLDAEKTFFSVSRECPTLSMRFW